MELQQASKEFNDIVTEIRGLLNTIRGEVESSGSHFKGEAATTFRTVMSRYDTDAANLNSALESIAGAIATSGKTFHAQDQSSMQSIRTAGSGLNM